MSWCDKLGALPSVGFKFEPHFAPTDVVLNSLTPIMDKQVDGDQLKFSLDRQERFHVTISTFEGFSYGVEPSKLFVQFQHRLKSHRVSGEAPQTTLLTEQALYSDLLQSVGQKAIAAAQLLPEITRRSLLRVGIVTTTAVLAKDLPPGLSALVAYWADAWPGDLAAYMAQFTVEVGDAAAHGDRCIFTVGRTEEQDDDLVTVNLDWQRTFKSARSTARNQLDDTFARASADALAYFETVGEGSSFNEHSVYREH